MCTYLIYRWLVSSTSGVQFQSFNISNFLYRSDVKSVHSGLPSRSGTGHECGADVLLGGGCEFHG